MPDEIPIQKHDNLKEAYQEKEIKSDQPDKLSFAEIMKPTQTDQAKLETDKQQPNDKERALAKELLNSVVKPYCTEDDICRGVRACAVLCDDHSCGGHRYGNAKEEDKTDLKFPAEAKISKDDSQSEKNVDK